MEAMKRQYHAPCFICYTCHHQLARQNFYQKVGSPPGNPATRIPWRSVAKCEEVVWDHIIRALGQAVYPACFPCVNCTRCIREESFALDSQNQMCCLEDFYRKFAPVCSICENSIIPLDRKNQNQVPEKQLMKTATDAGLKYLLSVEPVDQGCYLLKDPLFCKPCYMKQSAMGCC